MTPSMKRALDLLKQNSKKGIIQKGTAHVSMQARSLKTGRHIGEIFSISNQTLLSLQRLELVYCVYLIPGYRRARRPQKRRWKVTETKETP